MKYGQIPANRKVESLKRTVVSFHFTLDMDQRLGMINSIINFLVMFAFDSTKREVYRLTLLCMI